MYLKHYYVYYLTWMYRYLGLDKNLNYIFSLIKNNKIIVVSNKINKSKYIKVKQGDFVIYEKDAKNAFTATPNYKLGDIIYINNPDRYSFTYDGIKIRRSTQYEFDKYEFNNFPNISCNAVIHKLLMSYY